jgi:hypothetical protein
MEQVQLNCYCLWDWSNSKGELLKFILLENLYFFALENSFYLNVNYNTVES